MMRPAGRDHRQGWEMCFHRLTEEHGPEVANHAISLLRSVTAGPASTTTGCATRSSNGWVFLVVPWWAWFRAVTFGEWRHGS